MRERSAFSGQNLQTLRALQQSAAHRGMMAASDQAAVSEISIDTLLNDVTPIGLDIYSNGNGGLVFEAQNAGGGGVIPAAETPDGLINSSNVNFTLTQALAPGFLLKNGMYQREGVGLDYVRTGANLALGVAPDNNVAPPDWLWFVYTDGAAPVPEVPVGAINSTNMNFTISNTAPGFLTRNGLIQRGGVGLDYTRAGVNLTLATPPDGAVAPPDWLLWTPL
jgi:hypothetical protein